MNLSNNIHDFMIVFFCNTCISMLITSQFSSFNIQVGSQEMLVFYLQVSVKRTNCG